MLTFLQNWKMTSSAISSQLAQTSATQEHLSTVQRSVVRSGPHGGIAAKTPHLWGENKAKQLNYAQKKRNWDAEKLQQVFWIDESKSEISGWSIGQFVCWRAREHPTVKHGGGSLQVWGTTNGVGNLVRINDVLDAEKYKQILIHHAVPSGGHLTGFKFILQQDNNPKHTANDIRNYLQPKEEQEVLDVMVMIPTDPWSQHQRVSLGLHDSLHPQKICCYFSKMFGTTSLPSSFKNKCKCI